jgi:hypothetical protein
MNDIERQFENFVRQIKFNDTPNPAHRDRLGNELIQTLRNQSHRPAKIWRIIMKSQITKLTAAAAVILIAVLLVTFFNATNTPLYAFEQTVEAHHTIRNIYIKSYTSNNELSEQFRLQFDDSGKLLNARMEWAETEDGPKVSVINNHKAQVWFKKKNFLVTVLDTDERVAKQLYEMATALDPKLMVDRLQMAEMKGRAKLEINQPRSEGGPIIVTATYVKDDGTPYAREILTVEPATKLVSKLEKYDFVDGEYILEGRFEFLNYNEEIKPETFVLNVPDDVIRIDQTTQEIGLPKDNLSDNEIAQKVARGFFEALIAKDYASAGKLAEGLPADFIEEHFGKVKYLRIVSIGEPTPHPNPDTKFLCVPCEIEVEKDGVKSIEKFIPNIRPVYSDLNRWTIGGGI